MKTDVVDLLKTYGLVILSADVQNNRYKVKFDGETIIKMRDAVGSDLSLYEINIYGTFDISIENTVNGCCEVIQVPRLLNTCWLDVF